jgi:hypothetical protein
MKIYIISFVFCIISAFLFFSCGFANYAGQGAVGFHDSRTADDETDESTGVFTSSAGRLESGDTCIDNDDCVELCDSMLQKFSDQKKCYDETEKEVQALRDVYNNLAIGNPRKLQRLDKSEMDPFLVFGPRLWADAITGFERGRKENCKVVDNPDDARDREDCKFDDYYKQQGYWSSGAAAALEWIARNDWLSELIIENDEDSVIMKALLKVLANGGIDHSNDNIDDGEPVNHRDGVCPLKESHIGPPPSDHISNVKLLKDYAAFGSDCLDGKNFLSLSVERDNNYSVLLGHQVLANLCNNKRECIKYFYCNITNGPNPTDRAASPTKGTVFNYILNAGISSVNRERDFYSGTDTDPPSWCTGF